MARGSGRGSENHRGSFVLIYGDLYWVDLPDRAGREQRGRRPAIIWQDTISFGALPTLLIIPLTSRLDASRFLATLRIEPTPVNGLSTSSVALVFQLGACDVRRLGQKLGHLDPGDLKAIQDIALKLQRLA